MEIIWKSGVAAAVTALILLLAKVSGPKVAGAVGGIPIVFAISFVLVTMEMKDMEAISQFLFGGIIGALGGILFCALLWYLDFKLLHLYWMNFALAYLACFLFALGMATVFKI